MSRERSGCWTLALAVVAALLVGAFAGGLAGFGAAYWLVPRVMQTPAPTPDPTPTLPAVAQPSPTSPSAASITLQEESATVNVVSKLGPSVVTVVNLGNAQRDWFGNVQQPESLGSGVVIAPDGYVITNNHVVEDNASLSVITANGEQFEAVLVGADEISDLAVLRIVGDAGLPMAELGDSGMLLQGERVIAIGSALGEFKNTVTAGVVSGLERSIDVSDGFRMEGLIQTDAAINHGNSGGPLLNLQGQVIGINTMIIRGDESTMTVAEGLGFAIPANTVRVISADLIQYGYVPRPYLGISHVQLTPGMARYYGLAVTEGTLVVRVIRGSPAEQAGLQVSDVLVAINDEPLNEDQPYLNVLLRHKPGETVTLRVNRSGSELILQAVLTESQR